MSSVDLLDRIDDVTAPACAQCDGGLGDSPSDDFCSPECQQAWTAHQHDVQHLVGYIDPWYRPWDFPGAGHDMASWRDPGSIEPVTIPDWRELRLTVDTAPFRALLEAAETAAQHWAEQWSQAMRGFLRIHEPVTFRYTSDPHGRAMFAGMPIEVGGRALRREEPEPPPEPERLDLSWLDHYLPSLDEQPDPEQAARRLFPDCPIHVPTTAIATAAPRSGPAVHADPRRNRR